VQQEGVRTGWHAQRRECARSWVPGDATPFCLFHKKSTCIIFCACATLPDDQPTSAANCYLSHVHLFKFIEKTEWRGIPRHLATCAFVLLYVPPHVSPLAIPRSPTEGYSIRTNLSVTVPVAISPKTWPRVHLRHCTCPPAHVPSHCSTRPR